MAGDVGARVTSFDYVNRTALLAEGSADGKFKQGPGARRAAAEEARPIS